MPELYTRAAAALNIDPAHFAAWIDGDTFAGWNLDTVPSDALEQLLDTGIITEEEYCDLIA